MSQVTIVKSGAATILRANRSTVGIGVPSVADPELTALAGLVSAADQLPYFTGLGTAALTTLTAYGRSLIAAVDAPAAKVVLGLGLLASSVSGNTATIAGALTGARNYTLPDASMTFAGLGLPQTWTASQTLERSTTSGVGWATRVTADTVDRWRVRADGQMDWGTGAGATDVTLYRTAVGTLTCTGALGILGAVTTTSTIAATGSIRTTTSFFEGPISGGVAFNAYYSGGWKYRANGYATALTDNGASGFILQAAPTGVADAAPAWQAVLTGTPTAATFSVNVVFPNGTSGTPGIRTSENHGLYRFSSTALGFAAAGVSVASITSGAALTLDSGASGASIAIGTTSGSSGALNIYRNTIPSLSLNSGAGGIIRLQQSNSATATLQVTDSTGASIYLTVTPTAVTVPAAGTLTLSNTTDASAIGTAGFLSSGGGSIAKSLWVGGTAGNYVNIANSTGELRVNGTKVVSSRKTGWTAQTATAARTDLGASPTVGAIASFLRALYDDLAGHGLIGA